MEKIVELFNISKNYHEPASETKAITDVSFYVYEGEFVSIVGPSGCGKSTILSIISGLLSPSSGSVLIRGKPNTENNGSVGYMLQRDHLFDWRNILQNVTLGLEVKNRLTDENVGYVKDLLELYGLKDFAKHYPSQLSGGMRQRAALIRTLALKPELLLLDEPFSALDYQTRLNVADDITGIIRKENKTAILVTHDISEAISTSDRVIVLSNRPSTISNIYEIKLTSENKSPLKAREAPEFRHYFNAIWKELNKNV